MTDSRRSLWLPVATYAAATLLLRARQFTIDALYYLTDVREADWSLLLHPHHLLMEPAYLGWLRLWQRLGWPGSDVVPLARIRLGT